MKFFDGEVGICCICGKEIGELEAKNPYYYNMICCKKCEKTYQKGGVAISK